MLKILFVEVKPDKPGLTLDMKINSALIQTSGTRVLVAAGAVVGL